MTPVTSAAMVGEEVELQLLSPDLSRVAFKASQGLAGTGGTFERGSSTFEFGPVGGPYTVLASVSEPDAARTNVVGANAGVPGGAGPFSVVVLGSPDHALLPPGTEREVAEQMGLGETDLYEWMGTRMQLVNVNSEGKLISPCGAVLGVDNEAGNAVDAISRDGSRIFFTSPGAPHVPGCLEPALYMRVDGKETVDVSAPEGVDVAPSARSDVLYDGASADGSKVFFTTATALTPSAGAGFHLYEYDTDAPADHRLTLIANEVETPERQVINPGVLVSENGAAVYYSGVCPVEEHGQRVSVAGICRYETATGITSFVAVPRETVLALEPWSTTPDGEVFLFASGDGSSPLPVEFLGPNGLAPELRGSGGHEELYRYDAADGSVMCVSCGEGTAPSGGYTEEPKSSIGAISFATFQPGALSMSEDGRRVFFQTTAKLVPPDTNENTQAEEVAKVLGAGTDVYEWEEDGVEEEPGVFCVVANGCTHLISAGEAVGPERFLGASANGDNIFFTSAAQLLPQATPEFTNIYDARVDGGFPPPPPSVECTDCQGVGSPPPPFSTPASETFAGAGNQTTSLPPPSPPGPSGKSKGKPCRRGSRTKHGKCVRVKARKRRKS
jgi:hypothetical protein